MFIKCSSKFNDNVKVKNLVILQNNTKFAEMNQPIAPLLVEILVPKEVSLYVFMRKVS